METGDVGLSKLTRLAPSLSHSSTSRSSHPTGFCQRGLVFWHQQQQSVRLDVQLEPAQTVQVTLEPHGPAQEQRLQRLRQRRHARQQRQLLRQRQQQRRQEAQPRYLSPGDHSRQQRVHLSPRRHAARLERREDRPDAVDASTPLIALYIASAVACSEQSVAFRSQRRCRRQHQQQHAAQRPQSEVQRSPSTESHPAPRRPFL